MVGIVSYGAYIPLYRMSRDILNQVWGTGGGKSERAVANYDEDTITMAVDACVDALRGMERQADGLYFASTSPAYREKQCASMIAAALDFPVDKEFFTVDFSNSLRAGANALIAGYEAVRSGRAKKIVITAAESRLAPPNTESEALFGDGAAAFVLGDANVAAEIDGTYSVYSEFMDTWRREEDRYPLTWEDRFIMEEGYEKQFPRAIAGFLAKYKLNRDTFSKFVLYAPDGRRHAALIRAFKLDPNKVQAPLFDQVGYTGCALVPMMLVGALEEAKPGDRILVANYSDGADIFSLKVTDQIEKIRDRRGTKGYLRSKYMISNYGKYAQFRDLMEWEAERRPRDVSSQTMLWRESNQFLRSHGGKCRKCGTVQHPIQRVCAVCQAKDDYEEVRLSDKKGTLFTFAMDDRAMVKDLPNVVCIVDFEGGGRYTGVLTDRIPEKIKVGMEVEMTLRKLHEGSGIHNYCWKPRPLRV